MEKSALVYIFLTVITVGIALIIRNREYVPLCLKAGYGAGGYRPLNRERAANLVAETVIYLLLTGVSACRIAVGNDYWVYRFQFNLIMQNRHVSYESGFNFVVRLIQDLFGYDEYLPVFGFFSIVTVLFFVMALHDQAENYAFSLFLLLTGGYYFNSLNTVRYYFALAIALFSMKYVLRREFGKFILLILAGALFHKSILLVIPAYLAAYYLAHTTFRLWHGMVIGAFLVSLVAAKDVYRFVIFKIYPFYENSAFDSGRISYANVAKCLGVLLIYFTARLVRKGKLREKERFYSVLNLFGLVVFCCGGFIPEVTRIGYYMIISQIFLIPGVVETLREGEKGQGAEKTISMEYGKWFSRIAACGSILAFTFYFVLLLKQMYLTDVRLLPYLNWIFN
ncbi:MAG: EpsG family protein [Lachnospiraceae bacterium]|nr:EpsG family protein [Lachnospiraceae bacterium]